MSSGTLDGPPRHLWPDAQLSLIVTDAFRLVHDSAGIELLRALAEVVNDIVAALSCVAVIDGFLNVAGKFPLGDIKSVLQFSSSIGHLAYPFRLLYNRNCIARIRLTMQPERWRIVCFFRPAFVDFLGHVRVGTVLQLENRVMEITPILLLHGLHSLLQHWLDGNFALCLPDLVSRIYDGAGIRLRIVNFTLAVFRNLGNDLVVGLAASAGADGIVEIPLGNES